MKNDPIVEEVRETRRRLMAAFGNDPVRYWKHLRDRKLQHPALYASSEDLDHARCAVAEPGASYGTERQRD